MAKFEPRDVIRHIDDKGEYARYRIQMVLEEQGVYKVQRLDTKRIQEIPISKEDSYVSTESPTDSFVYQEGQVLLKKDGSPRIGVIFAITPLDEDDLTEYEIAMYEPSGQFCQTAVYQQKELSSSFEIRNFEWVIKNGDPRKAVRLSLDRTLESLQKRVEKIASIQDKLIYFETEMDKDAEEEKEEEASEVQSEEADVQEEKSAS